MANCYRCGAPNAIYRRTTYSGYSVGNWWSKRSYGYSSRRYYGVHSVCQECAKAIDNWNRIKLFIFILIVAICVIVYLGNHPNTLNQKRLSTDTSTYSYKGETALVISANGLNLRAKPDTDASLLLSIPYNDLVGVVDKTGKQDTIDGRIGRWYFVDFKGVKGWAWSKYLQIQP